MLVVDQVDILSLSSAEKVNISNIQSLLYQDGQITTASGHVLAENVTNLIYYDGLRFYRFESELLTPLDGPGALYHDSGKQQAFFSTDLSLNANLEQVIDNLQGVTDSSDNMEVVVSPPIVITIAPPTNPPPVVLTGAPTAKPQAMTTAKPDEELDEEDSEEECSGSQSQRDDTTKMTKCTSKTTKHTRGKCSNRARVDDREDRTPSKKTPGGKTLRTPPSRLDQTPGGSNRTHRGGRRRSKSPSDKDSSGSGEMDDTTTKSRPRKMGPKDEKTRRRHPHHSKCRRCRNHHHTKTAGSTRHSKASKTKSSSP